MRVYLLSFIIFNSFVFSAFADINFRLSTGASVIPSFALNITDEKNIVANNKHVYGAIGAEALIDLLDSTLIDKEIKLVLSAYYYVPKISAKASTDRLSYDAKISNTFLGVGISYKMFEHNKFKYYAEGGFTAGKVKIKGNYLLNTDTNTSKIDVANRYVSPYFALTAAYDLSKNINIGFKSMLNIMPKQIIRKDDNITISTNKNGHYHTNFLFFIEYKMQ